MIAFIFSFDKIFGCSTGVKLFQTVDIGYVMIPFISGQFHMYVSRNK